MQSDRLTGIPRMRSGEANCRSSAIDLDYLKGGASHYLLDVGSGVCCTQAERHLTPTFSTSWDHLKFATFDGSAQSTYRYQDRVILPKEMPDVQFL